MNRKKSLKSRRKGSIVSLMMIALVVLLLMGVGMLSLGLRGRILALRTASEIVARTAADAGLTKALFEMNEKLKVKPWSDSNLPYVTDEALPNCSAVFSYTVTGDSDSGYSIESIGNYGWGQKKVRSTLRLRTMFEYAIFMQDNIALKNGTTIDGYNLNVGDQNLKIGTNSINAGAIIAKTGVTIDGDVVVGVGGDPAVVINNKDEALITGNTHTLDESQKFPSINVPKVLVESVSGGIITDPTTISSSGRYDGINLGNSKIIKVDGSVKLYVSGDIILDNSAQIQIDSSMNPDASLTLYIGGNIVSQNGGFINNLTLDSKKLKIYGLDTCQNIDFKTNGVFYGAVYAPNADIRLHNSVTVHGSILANSFTQDVNADFHYDASLRKANVDDELVRFVVKRWSEE